MRPYALLTALLLGTGLLAQTPEAFNYQGVARDAGGDAITNTSIGVQFQLHQGTAVGTVVYSETHSPTTNDLGLFSLEVGNGTPGTGTFAVIDWSAGPYFLEVGLDPAGGSSYTSVGTQQLLSVPYALHAKTADMADDGDWVLSGDTVHSNGRRVGIGTSAPSQDLDVEGTFQLNDGTQADKRILTSDADGNASWQELSAAGLLGAGNVPPSLSDDQFCLGIVSSLGIGNWPTSVAVSGNYAYVVELFSDELKVIDISDPAGPVLVGSLGVGPTPRSVSISGNFAYVVDIGSDDLKVIDISNPVSPVLISTLGMGASPIFVAASGNYVYVVDTDSDDLKVIDVSNPASPVLSGSLGIGPNPSSVAVYGNYAYVVDLDSEDLRVIDISTPMNPVLSGNLGVGPNPSSVAVSGDHAYVVDNFSDDLRVIDISSPASPVLTGSLVIGTSPVSIAISGSHAYVVDDLSDELIVVDISSPASPVLTSSLMIGSTPNCIAVSGNYAYVVDNGSDDLKVVELFCPTAQQQLTYDPSTGAFVAVEGWQVSADTLHNGAKRVGIGTDSPDTTLHVAGKLKYQDGTQGDKKILTSDAQGNASWQELSPQVLFGAANVPPATSGDLSCLDLASTIATGSAPFSVAVSGDHAFVVNASSNDMMVFNISNPAAPSLSATIATGSDPFSVAVSGDHAYVLNSFSNNMMVFNISNPAAPSLSATIATGSTPYSVAVSGDHAYVVNASSNNMMVFNISNPASPSLSATIATGSLPRSVAVSGDHAYVVNASSNNMMVFNISNPAAPSLSATIATGSLPRSVAVSGDHAYVVNASSNNMMVFNISNPAAPSLSATIATGSTPYSVAVSGDHAYVVNLNSNDMMVFNISNPAAPSLSATIATGSNPYSMAVSGDHAYVVNLNSNNMMVFELFCPVVQQQVTYDPATGSFGSAPQIWQISGDSVYVTDQRVGIGTTTPSALLDVRGNARIGPADGVTDATLTITTGANTGSGKSTLSFLAAGNGCFSNAAIELEKDPLAGQSASRLNFLVRDQNCASLSQRMTIRYNGRVGIGTSSPTRTLHVNNGSGNPNTMLLEATGSTSSYLRFNDDNTSGVGTEPYIGSNGDDFTINTGGSEAIRVQPDSDVQLNGYTKLGSDAPAIKQKVLTGSFPNAGGSTFIPHGLNADKILSVDILIKFAGSHYPPEGLSSYYRFDSTNILLFSTGTSTLPDGSPMRMLITYQE